MGWTSLIHPDDLDSVIENWRDAIASGDPVLHESRVRRFDGEYRWFLHRNVPFRDEQGRIVKWCGSSVDIDDRKRAEEQVHRDREELRQIIELVPQQIFVLSPDGEPVYWNRVALEYTGLTLEESLTSDILKVLIHPDDLELMVQNRDQNVPNGVAFEHEVRVRRNDGQYRWFLVRYNPLLGDHGQVTHWYGTATDINERKQAEETVRNENFALREEIDKASMFESVVGTSKELRAVLSRVSKVAPTESTVLVTGETGTGKELIARAIHKRSRRKTRAFIAVNCAAIPQALIASELFGHEKGAFTGATQRRLGRFELANQGTIFLDEVGDLPPETQIALLRVLQEGEIERVGANRPIPIDVRVVAATNRDIEAEIAEGKFRSDLYYRLNVFPIEVPPLRERKDDIKLLVEYFIERFSQQIGRKVRPPDQHTIDVLASYAWPGNVRELQNVIQRSLIVAESDRFMVDENWLVAKMPRNPIGSSALEPALTTRERQMIESALAECRGRVAGPNGAATRLGIPVSTLESKIKSLTIDKYRFKSS
jgi:formate hydrogenlyase transcriptional activator